MSTVAEVQDVEELKAAIAEVRSDEGSIGRKSWVLAGHIDGNPNLVGIIAQDVTEEASLESFREKLEDDQVMYGLLRLSTTFDMSSTVKFVYVKWVGDRVPFAKKGRFGVVHGSVEEHFHPYHVIVETGHRDDLTEDELVKLLEEGSGTRNKVIEGDLAGRQERGFTAHSVKKQEKGQLRSVAPAGATIEVSPELNEAIGDVRNDKDSITWVVGGFEEGNLKKPLVLVSKGEGDIDSMKEHFEEDQVMCGLYRTSDVIDDIQTVKFVYVYWVGEQTKPLVKGKVSAYAGPMEQVFSPAHVTLSFSDRDELTEGIIKDKVMFSSGSKSHVK